MSRQDSINDGLKVRQDFILGSVYIFNITKRRCEIYEREMLNSIKAKESSQLKDI